MGRQRAFAAPLLRVLALTVAGLPTFASFAHAEGGWSGGRRLAVHALGPPQIAFPSSAPAGPTGPGAVAWSAAGEPQVAWLERDDGLALVQAEPQRATRVVATAGAGFGRLALLVAPASGGVAVLQGHGDGRLTTALALPDSPPLSLAHAYLGDVALASVRPGRWIDVSVERYYLHGFASPRRIPIGPGAVTALTATMDYRADVLVAWQQEGLVYARLLRASGRDEPTQRLGPSAASGQVDIQALVSDNNHGMVAWSTTAATDHGAPTTTVRLALSGVGVRFHGARTLASFADPQRLGGTPGSLALVRLATENVVLAWTQVEHGRSVALAAPAVFAGLHPSTQLGAAGAQSALAGLVPGAAGEAVALWRQLPAAVAPGGLAAAPLWASRVAIVPGDRVVSTDTTTLADVDSAAPPALAVDPGDDRPVIAWWARDGAVQYALGPGRGSYRTRAYALPPPAVTGMGMHWVRVAGAVVLALLFAVAVGWSLRTRRRGSRTA